MIFVDDRRHRSTIDGVVLDRSSVARWDGGKEGRRSLFAGDARPLFSKRGVVFPDGPSVAGGGGGKGGGGGNPGGGPPPGRGGFRTINRHWTQPRSGRPVREP